MFKKAKGSGMVEYAIVLIMITTVTLGLARVGATTARVFDPVVQVMAQASEPSGTGGTKSKEPPTEIEPVPPGTVRPAPPPGYEPPPGFRPPEW